MKALLEIINRVVHQTGGVLNEQQTQRYKRHYHRLLKQAGRECPAPTHKEEGK